MKTNLISDHSLTVIYPFITMIPVNYIVHRVKIDQVAPNKKPLVEALNNIANPFAG